jgi:cytoskeleton protein RodZ
MKGMAPMGMAPTTGFNLRQIGSMLRRRREEQGITLTDISNTLFLTKSVVGALEAGNWDALPHPVYVKGYVTQYARLLNVHHKVAVEFTKQGMIQTPLVAEMGGGVQCSV